MIQRSRTPLLLSTLLILARCSGTTALGPALGEIPKPTGVGSPQEVIAIVGTNDIHGGILPQKLQTREVTGTSPQEYETGGIAYLASYLRILREEWGNQMLWLDGGDQFQGTLESNTEQGAPMVGFFNRMGLQGAAIGNHEFDWGVPVLESRMKEASYNYLAANVFTKGTHTHPTFPNTVPSYIYKIGRARVGVIGLSTLDTPKTTRAIHVQGLEFGNLIAATVDEAKALRKRGAQAIIIVSHVGLKCPGARMGSSYALRREEDSAGPCTPDDEMVRFLEELPEGTVDAVVSGHSHTVVHHWVHGVPVIQAGAFGRYLNVIYLTIDVRTGAVISDASRIEGPIPVCPKVFRNQRDCDGESLPPREGRGSLVSTTFHGKSIRMDSEIGGFVEHVSDRTANERNRIVGHAEHLLEHRTQIESPLGNLVADAIREAAGADFALVNRGGIRAPIDAGDIPFGTVFRTLPFDNTIVSVEVTASELQKILRVAESGARGFGSVSGLKLKLLESIHDARGEDLDKDGKIEPWEFKTLLEIADEQGKPLKESKTYRLATLDFLATGGDDLGWPFSHISKDRIHPLEGMLMRDAFVKYLQLHSPVAPPEKRFQFVKGAKAGSRRKGARSRAARKKTKGGFDRVFE